MSWSLCVGVRGLFEAQEATISLQIVGCQMGKIGKGLSVGLPPSIEARQSHDLTERMHDFAIRVSNGVPPTDAATLAGYKSPKVEAWRLLQLPKVQKFLKKARQNRIDGELAGLALSTLKDLLTDKETSAETRRKAAKDVLEMAGHGDKSQQNQDDTNGKPLSEFTSEDFEVAIRRAEAQAAKLRDITTGSGSGAIEGEAQTIDE